MKFGRNVRYVKDNLFPLPPVFELMRRNTSLSLREMARLFNLGHRMEIVCDAGAAEGIMEISQSMGVDARVVGRVEEGGEKPTLRLTLEGEVIEFQ